MKRLLLLYMICGTFNFYAALPPRLLPIDSVHLVDLAAFLLHPVSMGAHWESGHPGTAVVCASAFLLASVYRGAAESAVLGDRTAPTTGIIEVVRAIHEMMLLGISVLPYVFASKYKGEPQARSFGSLFSYALNGGLFFWHATRACDRVYRSWQPPQPVVMTQPQRDKPRRPMSNSFENSMFMVHKVQENPVKQGSNSHLTAFVNGGKLRNSSGHMETPSR